MSRSRFRDNHDLSRGESARRGGNEFGSRVSRSSSAGESEARNRHEPERSGSHAERDIQKELKHELMAEIDAAAADRPTMTEFLDRLERRGIAAIPSIQSSGRLNGISFRWRGETVKGSELGRAYTAKGLQQKKGLKYDAQEDRDALIRALDRVSSYTPETRIHDRAASAQSLGRSSRTRDRETGLNRDQEATVMEIGKFRTVDADDIRRYRYEGDGKAFARDLRVLRERELVESRTVSDPRRGSKQTVVVLTAKGKSRARNMDRANRRINKPQQYYAGFVKPAEVRHDAAIYRMYQAEQGRIERAGGSVKRVVLDYELKRGMYSTLNRGHSENPTDHSSRKQQIAEKNGLAIVQGTVVFPDLRIEYETDQGEIAHVDLELASDQYKTAEVMLKHSAGLRIYGPDNAPRCAALRDPEIVAGLISF